MSKKLSKRARAKKAADNKVRYPALRILKKLRESRSLQIPEVVGKLTLKYSERSYGRNEAGTHCPDRDRILDILIYGFAKEGLPPIDVRTINNVLAVKSFVPLSPEEISKHKLVDDTETIPSDKESANNKDAIEVLVDQCERQFISGHDYYESNFYVKPPESVPSGLGQFTLVVRILPFHWEERMRRGSSPWNVGQPWIGFCDTGYYPKRSVVSPISIGGSAQPHLIVSTFDGYSLNLYINGALVRSDHSTSREEPFENGQQLAVGFKYVGDDHPEVIGFVSDVLIYNRSFLEPRVREVWNAYLTVVGCHLDTPYSGTDLKSTRIQPRIPNSFRIIHGADPGFPPEARFPPARI